MLRVSSPIYMIEMTTLCCMLLSRAVLNATYVVLLLLLFSSIVSTCLRSMALRMLCDCILMVTFTAQCVSGSFGLVLVFLTILGINLRCASTTCVYVVLDVARKKPACKMQMLPMRMLLCTDVAGAITSQRNLLYSCGVHCSLFWPFLGPKIDTFYASCAVCLRFV